MKKINAAIIVGMLAILMFVSACSKTADNGATDKKPADNTAATTNASATNSAINSSTNSAKTSATTATTSAPKDISGSYTVSGTNENGAGNYNGTLDVTKRDEVYQFSWDTAGKKFDGVGVQNDKAIAVSFADGTSGKGCGVVLYKINADGSLDGKAGYWGVNESETEKATRTSGGDLIGEYDVKGTNPDGKEYTGKLNVKSEGSGYAFSWTGASAMKGFGIKQSDTVAVGIGGEKCSFVSYLVNADGSLEGKWGSYGSTAVGTETAKKK